MNIPIIIDYDDKTFTLQIKDAGDYLLVNFVPGFQELTRGILNRCWGRSYGTEKIYSLFISHHARRELGDEKTGFLELLIKLREKDVLEDRAARKSFEDCSK